MNIVDFLDGANAKTWAEIHTDPDLKRRILLESLQDSDERVTGPSVFFSDEFQERLTDLLETVPESDPLWQTLVSDRRFIQLLLQNAPDEFFLYPEHQREIQETIDSMQIAPLNELAQDTFIARLASL